ncbi:MAG: hypothetical protein ACR2KQ_01130 [Actinomycetota bacterium]
MLSAALGNVEVAEDGAAPDDTDSVLGTTLAAEVETEAAGPAARAAEVLGGVLPFTGPGLIKFPFLDPWMPPAGGCMGRRAEIL